MSADFHDTRVPPFSTKKPTWICNDCANKKGWKMPINHVATFHDDKCGDCHQLKSVTEPRDYNYGQRSATLEDVLLYAALMESQHDA